MAATGCRREGLLHVGCTQLIVRHSIRAIEFYHVAFGDRCSVGSTVLGLRRLLELTCLAIRYDSHLDALVEPLKIHIERAVRRRVRKALPRGPMVQRSPAPSPQPPTIKC